MQASNHRHSHPQDENEIGLALFPLQEYHDDKKFVRTVESFDTEETYVVHAANRPETACSRVSDWKAGSSVDRRSESKEDLVKE